jgi:hypothetical protein
MAFKNTISQNPYRDKLIRRSKCLLKFYLIIPKLPKILDN